MALLGTLKLCPGPPATEPLAQARVSLTCLCSLAQAHPGGRAAPGLPLCSPRLPLCSHGLLLRLGPALSARLPHGPTSVYTAGTCVSSVLLLLNVYLLQLPHSPWWLLLGAVGTIVVSRLGSLGTLLGLEGVWALSPTPAPSPACQLLPPLPDPSASSRNPLSALHPLSRPREAVRELEIGLNFLSGPAPGRQLTQAHPPLTCHVSRLSTGTSSYGIATSFLILSTPSPHIS